MAADRIAQIDQGLFDFRLLIRDQACFQAPGRGQSVAKPVAQCRPEEARSEIDTTPIKSSSVMSVMLFS
jgi:hypothetical protein